MADPKKYKVQNKYGYYYTAESLSDIGNNINDEDLSALEIQGKGNYKISFKQQFETYYKGMILLEQDIEGAVIKFFMVYEENKMIISQIKKIKNEMIKLENPDNGRQSHIIFNYSQSNNNSNNTSSQGSITTIGSTSADKGKDKTQVNNLNYIAAQSANTDSNSKVDELEDIDNIDSGDENGTTLREKIKIPDKPLSISIIPNQISQNKNLNIIDKELELTKGTTNETRTNTSSAGAAISTNTNDKKSFGLSKNTAINIAEESLKSLQASIPPLRSRFISYFSVLFQC